MKFNLGFLAVLALALVSVGAVTWQEPSDGDTIEHAEASVLLNATSDLLGTPTLTYTHSKGSSGVNTTISSGVANNLGVNFNVPGDLIGSTQLSAVDDNGSVVGNASITVTFRSYAASDIVSIVIDFVGTYIVQFVLLASMVVSVLSSISLANLINFLTACEKFKSFLSA